MVIYKLGFFQQWLTALQIRSQKRIKVSLSQQLVVLFKVTFIPFWKVDKGNFLH